VSGSTALAVNEEYDPVTDQWSPKLAVPVATTGPASAVVNNKVYVIGGVTSGFVGTNEEYNPATNGWTTKAPMPTAREVAGSTAAVVNNRVYIIGGLGVNYIILPNNEEYNPATNTWTIKAGMPTARRTHAMTAVNNKIYAIGGTDSWSTGALPALSTNEEFAPTLLYVHKKN